MDERVITRGEVLRRLAEVRSSGKPLLGVSAGVGIVARWAEFAQVDLIFDLSTGISRNRGLATTETLGNAIDLTLGVFPELDNVVEHTPIVGGIEATDSSRRRLGRVIDQYLETGFQGICNSPTIGNSPGFFENLNAVGEGFNRETELIALARERDAFTVGFAYTPDAARLLAAAGADLVVARCGITQGGLAGPPLGSAPSLDAACLLIEEIGQAARSEAPDVFVLAHGGPINSATQAQMVADRVAVDGFLAESSIERIAVESAVMREIEALKQPRLRDEPARVGL